MGDEVQLRFAIHGERRRGSGGAYLAGDRVRYTDFYVASAGPAAASFAWQAAASIVEWEVVVPQQEQSVRWSALEGDEEGQGFRLAQLPRHARDYLLPVR